MFLLQVQAHLGSPGQMAVKRLLLCVVVLLEFELISVLTDAAFVLNDLIWIGSVPI